MILMIPLMVMAWLDIQICTENRIAFKDMKAVVLLKDRDFRDSAGCKRQIQILRFDGPNY